MRLFFAIPLPERLKDELARFQARARLSGVPASWPDPQGLHLTLAFLGEQAEATAPALMAVALQAAAKRPAFLLKTSRPGGFPKDGCARVLWLGLEAHPELRELADELRTGLRAAAVSFDSKPFNAHLTLARFKVPQDVAQFLEPPGPMGFEVRELVLYQSILTPRGSRHVSMGTAPLRHGPV